MLFLVDNMVVMYNGSHDLWKFQIKMDLLELLQIWPNTMNYTGITGYFQSSCTNMVQ